MKPKPKKCVLSFSKPKPRLVLTFENAKTKYITLKSLRSTDPDDRKAAQIKCDAINREIALDLYNPGKHFANDGLTLVDFAKKYYQHRQRLVDSQKISPRTFVNDKEAFNHLVDAIANPTLLSIDQDTVKTFVEHMAEKPMRNRPGIRSNENINVQLRALSSAWSWAVYQGLAEDNPFKKFPKLRMKNTRDNIRVFHPSELDRFRQYFLDKPPAHRAAFEFALATMARAGGIARLNEKDIFTEVVDGQPANLALLHEKGNKSRIVYLNDDAMWAINKMRSWYDRVEEYVNQWMVGKEVSVYQRRIDDGQVFFPFTDYHSISQMFRKAKQALGIQGRFHDLRKTAATAALDQSVDRRIIQEILGHTDSKVTDNHYLKISITAMVRALRGITAGQ